MKFKLVVASMCVLGLVTCPVLAATKSHHKNSPKAHKKMHHRVKHRRVIHQDYKDVAALPVQPAPVQVCTISEPALVLDAMTQNVGRSLPNPCNPGWYDRISISGGITVDVGKWGNRNANYMGENYQRLSLNDVYFNIAANVTDWAKAFASLSYNTATINDPTTSSVFHHVAEYNAAYDNNVIVDATHTVQVEQAFITLANFDVSPLFVQVGKQFQDFSRYELHPITESLTQVMSKTLATSAKLGFITGGFHGSVYVFDDPLFKNGQSGRPTNYGAAIGYEYPMDCNQLGWDVGIGYLYNLIGVNDIAYAVNQFTFNNSTLADQGGYFTRKAGLAVYADVITGPFYLSGRFTTTLARFNVLDLPRHGVADLAVTGAPLVGARGARPWAAGLQAGLNYNSGFLFDCHNQNIYVGYQTSREAAGLLIPKHRWLVGYGIDVWTNTRFGLEWDHDIGYSTSDGGNDRNTNLVSLRVGVKFA